MKKNILAATIFGLVFFPTIVLAQSGVGQALGTLENITKTIGDIVELLLPIVFALAILGFFWGIMMYVFSASGETKKNGKNIMLWSLIAVAIMASLFGIIKLAQQTLGIEEDAGDFKVPGVEDLGN